MLWHIASDCIDFYQLVDIGHEIWDQIDCSKALSAFGSLFGFEAADEWILD